MTFTISAPPHRKISVDFKSLNWSKIIALIPVCLVAIYFFGIPASMNYGILTFGVTDYVAQQRTLHYGAAITGEPRTQAEKDICIRLGQRLAEWVSYYFDGVEESHPNKVAYERFDS